MRYNSSRDAQLLALPGPSALALRAARARHRAPISRASAPLFHGGSFGAVGALGDATTAQVASTVGGAAAKYGIATYAAGGAWAGPIGIAAGAIVGLVLAKILNKPYLNVAQANAVADASLQAFRQYQQIAGQIPGRQLGVDAMNAIWNGAMYAGYFPGNTPQLCFHEGCLKYRGQPAWQWGTFHDGANNPFTFAAALQQLRSAQPAPSIYQPAGMAVLPIARTGGLTRAALQGFGALPDGRPEAVALIDDYFIPAAHRDNPPWAVPQNALEHQILYDSADAYLASVGYASTPFVAVATTAPPNTGGTITAADPTQGGVLPIGPGPGGSGLVGAPVASSGAGGGAAVGNTYSLVPYTNPSTGVTSYQIAPGASPGTPLTTAGPATAGLANIPAWGYLIVAAGIIFALARPMGTPEKAAAAAREREAA